MTDVDADYGSDHHEYEPGPTLRARLRDGWDRVVAGWRPDERTVGVVLLALYAAIVIERLLVIDRTWDIVRISLSYAAEFSRSPWQQVVSAVTQLLYAPIDLLIVVGAAAIALHQGWGRLVAVGGLAGLLTLDAVNAVLSLTQTSGPYGVRMAVGQVVIAAGAALPLAVLLWSRPAPEA